MMVLMSSVAALHYTLCMFHLLLHYSIGVLNMLSGAKAVHDRSRIIA